MAATMLSKHQTPGYREAPMDPAPYVDALGNPLPPIRKLDDLPNIKDTPPESSAAEVEGPISGTSALIQVDSGPSISQPEEDSPRNKARSARLDKPAEKPVVMVAHERGPPNSSRSDRQGSHSSAGSRGSRSGVDAAGEGSKSSKPRPKARPVSPVSPAACFTAMATPKPSLTRLETRAVEEDARKWYEEFCEWIRNRGQELDYVDLDNQLSEYLREKYFEGSPRSFAVSVVKAVKFEVPPELGRNQLWRARSACARWDSSFGPWTESDPEKVKANVSMAFRTPALLHFLGSSLGLFALLNTQRLFKAMVTAVDNAICRVYADVGITGGHKLLEDFRHFFTRQMFGDEEKDGNTEVFGQELCEIMIDTVGLLFNRYHRRFQVTHGLNLQDGNNLEWTIQTGGSQADVSFLGESFRRFLDPQQVSDVLQLLNPKSLATISQLFPDAKYDVAFLQETFEAFNEDAVYNLKDTHFLHQIRGTRQECYLSRPKNGEYLPDNMNHLLKTQKHLDPTRVKFYTQQLQEALKAGHRARPTALVLDFFMDGQIHDVQPDEDPALRGPGGRRKQQRRVDACDEKFMDSCRKAWFLLDGHHKVEAAAQLGCSLNFLVISPCAEPYTPLEATDEYASPLTRKVTFPLLWPAGTQEDLCIRWAEGNLCKHSPMLISSAKEPPQAWQDVVGCTCFFKDEWFPAWGFRPMAARKEAGRREMLEKLWERFGKEHELFTTYARARIEDLPDALQEEASGSALVPPEVAEELQAKLDECLDTIKWCASSITRDSLQDVKNTNRPAPVVKDVLEAVSILLAQPETRWDRLKQMISKPQFFDKLQRLDFQRSISKEQFKKLRDKLANPHFDEELIKTVSVPMVPLAMWCRAIGVYLSKTKYRGGPEIRPVAGAGATPQLHYEERREKVEMSIQPDLSVLSDEELRQLALGTAWMIGIVFGAEYDEKPINSQPALAQQKWAMSVLANPIVLGQAVQQGLFNFGRMKSLKHCMSNAC
ncbi:unnamed protein product [Cladocopium goreaui]|uniref:Dynein axonemal heavy chain 6 (Axonemal beta dynein heavy chain 6) (Ciliary dynein heavy chain 6) n=1 Tax=Cladocopium goreaui TaxID=2562237 RepID=A0A9P1G1M4_9DINO|nr:unnamed protein product [Cladocopium goreaui]